MTDPRWHRPPDDPPDPATLTLYALLVAVAVIVTLVWAVSR